MDDLDRIVKETLRESPSTTDDLYSAIGHTYSLYPTMQEVMLSVVSMRRPPSEFRPRKRWLRGGDE